MEKPATSSAADPVPQVVNPSAPAAPALDPAVEQARLQTLRNLGLLDTEREEEFDDLVQLASEICDTPISLISLIDSDRQWFKASVGVDFRETPREHAFCAHAIGQRELFIVEDATFDPRFRDNPYVTGDAHVRFYAGVPLHTSATLALGTLCVIDTKPRTLTESQQNALRILARQVRTRLELREQKIALARANEELRRLASTDSLTGLANRRAFEERMRVQFALAVRSGRPLSVLMIDVDDFKHRNDTFGHAAGDEALRAIGFILNEIVRVGDLAARLGGEEFAVLLPETDADHARTVAQRIRQGLAHYPLNSGPITVSIGIASKEIAVHSWQRLLECSDDAMYEAKKTGKDRIVLHRDYIRQLMENSLRTSHPAEAAIQQTGN